MGNRLPDSPPDPAHLSRMRSRCEHPTLATTELGRRSSSSRAVFSPAPTNSTSLRRTVEAPTPNRAPIRASAQPATRSRAASATCSGERPRCFPSVRVWGWMCTPGSVVAAAIDGVTGKLFRSLLTPSHEHVSAWLRELPAPVAVAYEAGPTGFGLYRHLSAAGIRCEVVAPSKRQRPAGERVKTDAGDALHRRPHRHDHPSVPEIDSMNPSERRRGMDPLTHTSRAKGCGSASSKWCSCRACRSPAPRTAHA